MNNRSETDSIVILGPTASGKTSLGVHLAAELNGEIISADSRQVYRGLDIGSGKDLDEYTVTGRDIGYHLIDCVDLDHEFSVFEFQKRFFDVFDDVRNRGKLPIIVGGTGLYLEAVLKGYRMADVPENTALRQELDELSNMDLVLRMKALKPDQHNTSDSADRDRTVRAIEIAEYTNAHPPEPAPEMHPLVLGLRWPREELHERIKVRLKERLALGMIEEVEGLRKQGVPDERLRSLGLEYLYLTDFLRGDIKNKNDLFQKLLPAIKNFAKRQGTWFRRMEKRGTVIHWIDRGNVDKALSLARSAIEA